MARIFISGSSDGLGKMAGELLIEEGHEVVLHARNAARAAATRQAVPGAVAVVVGDLASFAGCAEVADRANLHGRFDAVIHNVGVGYREPARNPTVDGVPLVLAVNTLAPYLLTALMQRPERLIYLSSGLHRQGDASLSDLTWDKRRWQGAQAYSDSKLHDALLAFAAARRYPEVRSNALEPGWVATKMGGRGAPDDLAEGCRTQAWLAVSDAPAADVSGGYFYHLQPQQPKAETRDTGVQDALLAACQRLTGVAWPR
jgi:NAD(P)-dependent dehydrogenase (short-subunit alcohol dehydrogenase family)